MEDELQKINITDNTTFDIESILDEDVIDDEPMLLVKWESFPRECATWIKKSTIINR